MSKPNLAAMPARRAPPPQPDALPDAELEVLAVLHQRGESDATELRLALEAYRPMGHASISTLLRRLEARGLVTRRRAEQGKAYLYTPVPKAADTYRSTIRRLLERVFRNDSLSLVSALFSVRPPSEKEARELRRLVHGLHRKPRP